MSQGPPRDAQVSPDGKWWWDGSKWVPTPSTPATQPFSPQPGALQPYQLAGNAVFVYGPRTNSAAVASLVFGIVSWFLCPFIGGLLAIIFGHVARGQIRRTGESGSGFAVAGLILGYFHLAAVVVVAFIWIVLLGGFLALLGAIGSLPTPTPSP